MIYRPLRPFELAKQIEILIVKAIASRHFWAAKLGNPQETISVSRAELYALVSDLHKDNAILTAGFFNKVIDEMKRAGVIGLAKGGSVVWLTDESLEVHGVYDEVDKIEAERNASQNGVRP